MQSEAFEAFT